jgi:hypothetical protein
MSSEQKMQLTSTSLAINLIKYIKYIFYIRDEFSLKIEKFSLFCENYHLKLSSI